MRPQDEFIRPEYFKNLEQQRIKINNLTKNLLQTTDEILTHFYITLACFH